MGIFLIALLLIVLIGPFLIPVPPLTNTVPAQQLADADSRFINVNGVNVHYKIYGQGEPTFILLHGFGASIFSWREVAGPLSKLGTVIAYDRPAFGLTDRPLKWEGENPYSLQSQINLAIGLMDQLNVKKAILIGNSAGGTVSMQVALQHPERVQALILVDPAVYAGGGAPAWVKPLLNTPQMDHLGPLFARQLQAQGTQFLKTAWHDPSKITPDIFAGYEKPLQIENWDKALWQLTLANQDSGLVNHLTEFTMPILVITGDDDRIVPTEQSLRLAKEIPNAVLKVIAQSGHVSHEEQPVEFLQAVTEFLASLK
jgi:pimeloyl-ACP methyl ester carboxylesterase